MRTSFRVFGESLIAARRVVSGFVDNNGWVSPSLKPFFIVFHVYSPSLSQERVCSQMQIGCKYLIRKTKTSENVSRCFTSVSRHVKQKTSLSYGSGTCRFFSREADVKQNYRKIVFIFKSKVFSGVCFKCASSRLEGTKPVVKPSVSCVSLIYPVFQVVFLLIRALVFSLGYKERIPSGSALPGETAPKFWKAPKTAQRVIFCTFAEIAQRRSFGVAANVQNFADWKKGAKC